MKRYFETTCYISNVNALSQLRYPFDFGLYQAILSTSEYLYKVFNFDWVFMYGSKIRVLYKDADEHPLFSASLLASHATYHFNEFKDRVPGLESICIVPIYFECLEPFKGLASHADEVYYEDSLNAAKLYSRYEDAFFKHGTLIRDDKRHYGPFKLSFGD